MNETQLLIGTIKALLKTHGITYAKLAGLLSISESSVKRMFAEQNFSLQRLAQICEVLEIDFSELARKMQVQQHYVETLSYEQEEIIANDILLILVTVCVLNRWSYQEIQENYELSEAQCLQKLMVLDKLGLIELLPNNRIKLRVSANFKWLTNGPIQRFFQQRIAAEYFQQPFRQDDEALFVLNGMLSADSNKQMQKKLQRLMQEFNQLNTEDQQIENDRLHGYTCILSIRGWKYGIFSKLRSDATKGI